VGSKDGTEVQYFQFHWKSHPRRQPKRKSENMSEGRKNILRIFGTDIPGDSRIGEGIRRIKGISFSTSKPILKKAGIDSDKLAGDISKEEKNTLEEVIEKGEIPTYLLNRRKDPETGDNKMLTSTNLEMQIRQDIEAMKKLGNYRGLRHRRGLPVRGQKTKSSFRGDSSVGVSTSKIKKEKSGKGE